MEPRTNNIPLSYVDALAALNGRAQRKLLSIRSTWLHTLASGAVGLRYQGTDVVTFQPDGSLVLDSGCYRQRTTKSRMNAICKPRGCKVIQERGEWVLSTLDGSIKAPFADGQVIGLPLAMSKAPHTSIIDHGWSDLPAPVPEGLPSWLADIAPPLDHVLATERDEHEGDTVPEEAR